MELEQALQHTAQRADYYEEIARVTGIARLKETEALSQLLAERNRIAAELKQHHDNLEGLVETRTNELSTAVAETQQLNLQLQQEIRERRRVEAAIRASEEHFRILVQDSPDVIMRFDRDLRHLYVNPVVEVETGIPQQDFIGKTHRELGFPPELILPWEEYIQRVFAFETPQRLEFQLPTGAWIDWILYPEYGTDGTVNAVLTTARDITAYKEIEETLRKEILERKRSEKRQRQLEAQLRQTQKLEALGRLAGGIAHDFNNVLAIMLGHVEFLLQDSAEGSDIQASLQNVWRAGERATELIRQISLFGRYHEHHLESTNLSQVIEETLRLIRATIPASIEIRSHIQPHCHFILADASQIQQILVNLCVNARHAMKERGGTLELRLTEAAINGKLAQNLGLGSGLYLKLTVSDTGQGIPASAEEHIFEPFFTTKDVGEGSGLGLAVVHGIVTGHGGTIMVESVVGQGTIFSIYFPVVEDHGPMVDTREESFDTEKGQGHILVVDDEPDLVNLYKAALTQSGYQVTVCYNGSDALSIFQLDPDRIDLVFTDQLMPGLTGIQLSEEIQKIRADVPIILATGYSDSISEHNVADYGLSEFLSKPIKIRGLRQTIRKILVN